MPIYVGSTLLVLASNSEAAIIFDGDVSDDEWESLQAENYEQTDYSHQFDTFTGQLLADLKNLFPFCLPFDLIDFFGVLSAEPVAPSLHGRSRGFHVTEFRRWNLEIDLSAFNEVAKIMLTMEVLVFIVGLILITRSHMIRG